MQEDWNLKKKDVDVINELWAESEKRRLHFEASRTDAARALGALLNALTDSARANKATNQVKAEAIIENGIMVGVKVIAGEEVHILKRNE